jgi:hypothetical protein
MSIIFSWRELDISLVFSWYSCSSFTIASYPKLHGKKWMMQSSTPVWAPIWNPGKNHYTQSNKKRVIYHDVLNLMVGRITQDLQWKEMAVDKLRSVVDVFNDTIIPQYVQQPIICSSVLDKDHNIRPGYLTSKNPAVVI